jgi:hypothetical protein
LNRKRAAVAVFGACATGVALSLVLATVGGHGQRRTNVARMPDTPPPQVVVASAPARAVMNSNAEDKPEGLASIAVRGIHVANDDLLCRRSAARHPAGPEAVASSPSPEGAVLAAERRIVAELRADTDAFSQAVAAWLDIDGAASELRDRQQRLAALAQTTTDARVYAMAFRECRESIDDGAAPECGMLSARQWAQLDHGNALPWVYVVGDASMDSVDRNEALFQIASSSRMQERPFAAAEVILAHAGSDGAGLVAANELVSQALERANRQTLPLYALLSACHDGKDEDSNVAQLCAKTSDLFLRHSDALAMRRIGGTMLPATAGDEAHRERLREQLASLTPAPRLQDAGDCASLRRLQEFQRRAGEIGEVGALRERAGAFDAQ